jgi:glycine hydroxymethyltransferase
MSDLPADFFTRPVEDVDPEIADVLANELSRQEHTLEMIASENFVPQAVLDCQGSVLTNKYAEGYPGRRYYGGCEFVDIAEQLAIDRARSCSAPSTPMCSPTAARPRTRSSTARLWNRATRSSA